MKSTPRPLLLPELRARVWVMSALDGKMIAAQDQPAPQIDELKN